MVQVYSSRGGREFAAGAVPGPEHGTGRARVQGGEAEPPGPVPGQQEPDQTVAEAAAAIEEDDHPARSVHQYISA